MFGYTALSVSNDIQRATDLIELAFLFDIAPGFLLKQFLIEMK